MMYFVIEDFPSFLFAPVNIKSVTDEKCAPYLFSQNESMGPSTINRERSNRNTTRA